MAEEMERRDALAKAVDQKLTTELPPCRVCDGVAKGVHYGVVTCEPCKAFFKRSLEKYEKKKESYICIGTKECPLEPGGGKICPYCRYEKCVSLGMSKDASKTGRYTYERKTNLIKEAKDIEQNSKPGNRMDNLQVDGTEAEHTITVLMATIRRSIPHLGLYMNDPDAAAKLQKRVEEEYEERIKLFGSMSSLPREVYEEIYKTTGIEIDNRQDMIKKLVIAFESTIKGMAILIGCIPGLEDITSEDHTALVKANCLDFEMIAYYRGSYSTLNVNSALEEHRNDIEKIVTKELIDEFFRDTAKIDSMEFTEEELALVLSISATFPDRCTTLLEREKIEKVQWKLFSCLNYLSLKNKKNPNVRLRQIVDMLIILRSGIKKFQALRDQVASWPMVQNHPFILDVLKDCLDAF